MTDNGKSLPESGSNSDILPGVRTEELKACESRFDLVRIFTRFSEIILPKVEVHVTSGPSMVTKMTVYFESDSNHVNNPRLNW